MLQLKGITLRRGNQVLLQHADLQLHPGQIAGLLGRNGAGKTSLIQCILGHLHEDEGEITYPKNWEIVHLEQEPPSLSTTAFNYVRAGDQAWTVLSQNIRTAEAAQEGVKLATYYDEMHAIDGYSIDARVATVLKGLGFSDNNMHDPISAFSGGWQMRLQLARVLLSRADLLLLDEPTNHLDLESIFWLEAWLRDYPGACMVISHDRDFLDQVCTHTIHMAQQHLTCYQGNYTAFARQFEEALLLQSKSRDKIKKQRAHMQAFINRFRAKATKARQVQSRVKALQKCQTSNEIEADNPLNFHFFSSTPTGYPTLSVEGQCGYGTHAILSDVSLVVGEGDRIGIIGLNGSGKSTLLKSLHADIPMLQGETQHHPKAKIGYFSQQSLERLHPEQSPYAHLLALAPNLPESQARTYLGGFGFHQDRVFESIGHFSGGEKARLSLALLIWERPNVLILDEPTNHLDMTVRETLIQALQSYEGALLLVSHDRHFLECCVDALWLVKNKTVTVFKGTLDDYQQQIVSNKEQGDQGMKQRSPKKTNKVQAKKCKQLEREIAKLTEQIEAITTELEDPALYSNNQTDRITALTTQRKQWEGEREAKELAWMEAAASSED